MSRLFSTLFLLLSLTACMSGATKPASSYADAQSSLAKVDSARMIIKTASVTLSVKEPSVAVAQVESLLGKRAGLIDSQRESDEYVWLDAKVPAEQLEVFVKELASVGDVESISFHSRDVTEQMVDIDARLKNLYSLRDKFRGLLQKASSVKDVLAIESELNRVQSEIDSIEGRRKSLTSQIEYSEVDIRIEKKTTYGPLGYLFKGLYWGVKKLFVLD